MLKSTICRQCKQEFEYDTDERRFAWYCTVKCRNRAQYDNRVARKDRERRCPKCGIVKPGAEYASGTHAYCKPCHAQYMRERRPLIAEDLARWIRVTNLRRYSLTLESFQALVDAQDGKCAICAASEPGGQGVWHVDHDHSCCSGRKNSCGKCIRGLLCSRCNIGLGNFKESAEVLRAAITYLENYSRRKAAPM